MEFENEIYTGSDTMIGDDGFIIPKGPASTDNLLFVSSGDGWIAYKFDISQFSCLYSSDHITKAQLRVTPSLVTAAGSVRAFEITDDPVAGTEPECASKPLDYQYIDTANQTVSFDITNLVRKCRQDPASNHGVCLKRTHLNIQFHPRTEPDTSKRPRLYYRYRNNAGLESWMTFDSQSLGRAGTAHVNLLNGNLVFTHQDTVRSGSRQPVSVTHVYNSCHARNGELSERFGMGAGWRLSVQQYAYYLKTQKADGTNEYGRVFVDGDGSSHYLKPTGETGKWKDEDGLGISAHVSELDHLILTDKQNNRLIYDKPTSLNKIKPLLRIRNAVNDVASVTYMSDSSFMPAIVTDGAGRETGFSYNTTPAGTLLNRISPPGYGNNNAYVTQLGFVYSGAGDLTEIVHDAQAQTTAERCATYYGYGTDTEAHYLIQVTNMDQNRLGFTYDSLGRVASMKAYFLTAGNEETVIAWRSYAYGDGMTAVRDELTGKKLIYHFNDKGNCICVNDELGYAVCAGYDSGAPANHPTLISKMQRVTQNLLRNQSFDGTTDNRPSYWTVCAEAAGINDTVTQDTENAMRGNKCVRMYVKSGADAENRYVGLQQILTGILKPDTDYTFSVYAKRTGDIRTWLECGAGNALYEEEVTEYMTDSYVRQRISFRTPADLSENDEVRVRICAGRAAGTAWYDCAQLEESVLSNTFNLLQNGSFLYQNSTAGPTGWSRVDGTDAEKNKIISYPLPPEGSTEAEIQSFHELWPPRPAGLEGDVLKMTGSGHGKTAAFRHYIHHSGSEGDVYTAGGWSFGRSMPAHGIVKNYDLRVYFKDSSGEYQSGGIVRWPREWDGWKFAAAQVIAPCDYDDIRYELNYCENINEAFFDGMFLYREAYGRSYQYDSAGNIISTAELSGIKQYVVYDDFDNITSFREGGREAGQETTMTWGADETNQKRHLLRTSVSPMGTYEYYDYEVRSESSGTKYANCIRHDIRADEDRTRLIRTKTEYDETDHNHAVLRKDERGKGVSTQIDRETDLVLSVQNPKGVTARFRYDRFGRNTQTEIAVGENENRKVYCNTKTYTNDRVTGTGHNTTVDASGSPAGNVEYTFGFDGAGRPTTVSVGGALLTETAYNGQGLVDHVDYSNGVRMKHTYDGFGRLTDTGFGVLETGAQTPPEIIRAYHYDYNNMGYLGRLTDELLHRVTEYAFDFAGRPVRKRIWQEEEASGGPGAAQQGRTHWYTARLYYNSFNDVSRLKETIRQDQVFNTQFTYDAEHRSTEAAFEETGKVKNTYDRLGRITRRDVTTGSGDTLRLRTEYSFAKGGYTTNVEGTIYDSTTHLVSRVKHTFQGEHDAGNNAVSLNIYYTYDDNGNIVSVKQNNHTVTYAYDETDQLIRVNDPTDPAGGTGGTTWVYRYDMGGNILQKEAYAYTEEGTIPAAPVQTDVYSYGNNAWKDQLTAVNGRTIEYDAMGNMTRIAGAPGIEEETVFIWEKGKQLKEIRKGTNNLRVIFDYNEEGLRVRKTVMRNNTPDHKIEYILNGKHVAHLIYTAYEEENGMLTETEQEMHFHYDAQGKPSMLIYGNSRYFYVYNLQGDVIALTNATGSRVVEYTYDAWGNPVGRMGTLADSIGTLQPFRYMGYDWNEETGLYYLRSRYYKPRWGRFISSDELIDNNLYSYCYNNAVNHADYEGKETVWMAKIVSQKAISSAIHNLAWYTRLKRFPVGSSVSYVLAKIQSLKKDIYSASEKTGTPVPVIQSVMFREMICYGLDDVVSDGLPGVSKGIMQIKGETALKALRFFNPNTQMTVSSMENVLSYPSDNIYYGALRLAQIASEYSIDFSEANDAELGLVFSTYNSGVIQNQAGEYGLSTLSYYHVFSLYLGDY